MSGAIHHRRQFMLASLGWLAAPLLVRAAAAADTGWQVQRLATDHLELECAMAGPATGRPVVLVHALGGALKDQQALALRLAGAGLRVIVPSLRGHGATRLHEGEPAAATDAAAAPLHGHDLLDLIDAIHVPEAVFASSGSGDAAALAFAALRPRRCKGLVLVGASVNPAAPADPASAVASPVASTVAITRLDAAATDAAIADAILATVRAAAWRT